MHQQSNKLDDYASRCHFFTHLKFFFVARHLLSTLLPHPHHFTLRDNYLREVLIPPSSSNRPHKLTKALSPHEHLNLDLVNVLDGRK